MVLRRSLSISLIALLLLITAAAFGQDDWEMSDDLKQKDCPPGTQTDGKGFCVPIKAKEAEKAMPVEPPAATIPAEKAPDPAAPKTPIVVPLPKEKTSPIVVPLPKEKTSPIVVPLPKEKTSPIVEPLPKEKTSPIVEPLPSEKVPEPKPTPAKAPDKKKSAASPPKEDASAAEDNKPKFVKGELSALLGTSKLVTTNNRVGLRLGWQQIDLMHYLTINPELDLRFGKLTFGLGVPLALEIFDGNLLEGDDWKAGFSGAGSFRTKDWDEWQEYARFIRYLTYGRKEDNIYASLSQFGSNTLGHGALMRRYSVNIDPDSTRVAGQFDMYNDYAGFEIMTNSIVSWDLFGALAFVKPLSFFMDHPIARSLSIGFTYAADRDAPVFVRTRAPEGANPALPFWVEGDSRPAVDGSTYLHAMGVDLEIKLLKTDSLDLKPFVDFSWMMPTTPDGLDSLDPEGGNGFTFGLLGRFNLGSDPVHAFRVIGEFRSFSANYQPGYFDSFYEVQKYFMDQHYARVGEETCASLRPNDPTQRCLPPTKFNELFVNRKGQDRRLGYYLEFNYSIVEKMSLTLALEGSNADRGNHFLAHLEVPALSWLQFFVTYHQRSMDSLGDLFSMDAADKIIFAALRLRILPFLFINFRYTHTLMFSEGNGDLNADGLEDAYRLYQPSHAWMGDIEFGWEF